MKQITLADTKAQYLVIGNLDSSDPYINMTCQVLDAEGNAKGNDEINIPLADLPKNIQSMVKSLVKFVGRELNKKAINEDIEPVLENL